MTAYVQQGELMRLPFNRTHGAIIPSSMFYSVDAIAIMLFIPLLYNFIYPRLLVSDTGFNLSQLKRIGLGMVVAMASLLAAFLVEWGRRNADGQYQIFDKLTNRNLTVADIPVFYQIPQYALAGIAEVLVIVSGEFTWTIHSGVLSIRSSFTAWVMQSEEYDCLLCKNSWSIVIHCC